MLRELDGMRAGRSAPPAIVSVAAAVWPDGREVVRRGVVEGRIAPGRGATAASATTRSSSRLEGDGRTFGEMTADEKHALSHRGRAFRALRDD